MRTDAPSFIELSLREKDGNLLIHVINGNPGRDISLVGSKGPLGDRHSRGRAVWISRPLCLRAAIRSPGAGWLEPRTSFSGWYAHCHPSESRDSYLHCHGAVAAARFVIVMPRQAARVAHRNRPK